MTSFGQTQPDVPQIYRFSGEQVYTKAGFVSYLCQILRSLGMVPRMDCWSWDPFADSEYVVADGTVAMFPFDYPDESTFKIGGKSWRPCVVLTAWFGGYSTSVLTEQNNYMTLFPAVREDGEFHLAFTSKIALTCRNNSFAPTAVSGTSTYELNYGDTGGAEVYVYDWKPYASFSGNDKNTLTVRSVTAYLGTAGLWIYIGTGTEDARRGDILSLGLAFGGSRYPGRADDPENDLDLNRINPVIPIFAKESGDGSWAWDVSAQRLGGLIHGISYQGKYRSMPVSNVVRGWLMNADNLNTAVLADYRPWTIDSPRNIGGQTTHILGRVVLIPHERAGYPGDLYSRPATGLDTSTVRPRWNEVYSFPGMRFTDITIQTGVFEDAETLTDWEILPHYATGMGIALNVENRTERTTLGSYSAQVVQDTHYTMRGPGGAGFTFPNVSQNDPTPQVVVSTSASATPATGTLVFGTGALDGETFVLDDGVNAPVTFEMDSNNSVVETNTLRRVVIDNSSGSANAANAVTAINDAPVLNISASAASATVTLTNGASSGAGNVSIVENVTSLTASGMSGGAPSVAWDDTQNGTVDVALCVVVEPQTGLNETATTEWTFTLPADDAPETFYKVEFDWRHVGGSGSENQNPCVFQKYYRGSWITAETLVSAGSNTGHASYLSQTESVMVQPDSTYTASRTLKVRWRTTRSTVAANSHSTLTLSNVHLKKIRYLES